MYTGKVPLPNLRTVYQIAEFYLSGKRPSRPCPPEATAIPDELWSLIESCWKQEISARPSARHVVQILSSVVAPATVSQASDFINHVVSPLCQQTNSQAQCAEVYKKGERWSAVIYPIKGM